MPAEPNRKRVVAFFDGQNLFHAAKEAFGHGYPNYDCLSLAQAVVSVQSDWRLKECRFYTGVPDAADNARWHNFWQKKLLAMSRQGVRTYTRPLRYRNKTVRIGSTQTTVLTGDEKGIDVRIALDMIRLAHRQELDVALVFSQDQDLAEAAAELRTIAREQGRWIKAASAFPVSPTSRNKRGVNATDWIKIDRAMYDTCLDPRDYR